MLAGTWLSLREQGDGWLAACRAWVASPLPPNGMVQSLTPLPRSQCHDSPAPQTGGEGPLAQAPPAAAPHATRAHCACSLHATRWRGVMNRRGHEHDRKSPVSVGLGTEKGMRLGMAFAWSLPDGPSEATTPYRSWPCSTLHPAFNQTHRECESTGPGRLHDQAVGVHLNPWHERNHDLGGEGITVLPSPAVAERIAGTGLPSGVTRAEAEWPAARRLSSY